MRTGHFSTRLLAALALAIAARAASALELGLVVGTSNLQLPWTPVEPISASVYPATNYFVGGNAWMSAPLGEDASIRVSYERDPVTRNSAIAAVQFERGIAKIAVGPLIGFLNSGSAPFSAGISASVRLQWPGVAYISMRSDGGTAVSILQSSDPQARTEFSTGFYLPNAIISGLVSAERFNELDSNGGLVTDSLYRYAMTVDVFKKNVPYTALMSMGYELRSKHYATENVTDSLGAIVLGLDATMQLNRAYKLMGGISTGAYVFGVDALKNRGPSTSEFLFSANLGLAIDFSALQFAKQAPKEKAEQAAPRPDGSSPNPETTDPEAPAEASSEKQAAESPAPPAPSKLSIEMGPGIYYDSRISLPKGFELLAAVLNTRAGAWASVAYSLSPKWSIGGELGVSYMTMQYSSEQLSLFDLPVHAVVRYRSEGAFGADGFLGMYSTGVYQPTANPSIQLGFDFGARLWLGSFFAEAAYVIGPSGSGGSALDITVLQNYPRFGLGYCFKIKKAGL